MGGGDCGASGRLPLVQLCGCGRWRQEGPGRVCLHVRRRRVASGPGVPRDVDARGDERGSEGPRGGEGRLPCWTRRCVFPLKGGSAAGHSGKVGIGLARGSEKVAKRILELLADGPMRPSALREAVGIRSRVHFSRCYMTPLVEKGLVARTDPDKPMSPRQEYKLA